MTRLVTSLILFFSVLVLAACSVVQDWMPSAAAAPATEYINYTAQTGDNMGQIAARYHVTIEQLITVNADKYPSLAKDPSSLKPGWQLRIPKISVVATPEAPRRDLEQVAQTIVKEINTARGEAGLVLLTFKKDDALAVIASSRSADMIARNYFSHYDPLDGQEPLLRNLQANKFIYHVAGENIAEIKNDSGWTPPWLTVAARYTTDGLAQAFVEGWLNSPEHRANIFNVKYRRTSVALAVSAEGRRIVATQVFSD